MAEFLAHILQRKQRENRRRRSYMELWRAAAKPLDAAARSELDRRFPVGAGSLSLIGEIKFASPSAGVIRARVPGDVKQLVHSYLGAGVDALSVLADGRGFRGSPLDVRRAAQSAQTTCPVLFKEFVLEPQQVYCARAMGASMVLLIVRALDDRKLDELLSVCELLGMLPLVEVFDEVDAARARAARAPLIGVNARDLHRFAVDRGAAALLVRQLADSAQRVLWLSGVRDAADAALARESGACGILVGEALMRSDNPAQLVASLKQA